MNRFLLLLLVAVVVAGLLVPSAAQAQRKNVTFIINTASVPDTVNAASAVVITGATQFGDTALTNWGSGAVLTNIGGDYWSRTFPLLVGDTLNYKIKIYGGGWEENINGPLLNNNRNFFVPNSDTVLLPEFWNNGNFPQGKNIGVFTPPYTAVADSFISVYVRVNMKGVTDNAGYGWTAADKDSVCVLGDGKGGPDLDWGTPFYLTQELPPTNSGSAFGMPPSSFYSGRLRFRKSQLTAGLDVAYKFRLGSNWSYGALQRSEQGLPGDGNRHFTMPVGLKDTTLQWVWFANTAPVARANPDTCYVTFNVDMKSAIDKGGYLSGDTVQVQSGFFGTGVISPKTKQLQNVVGSIYSIKDTIITKIGSFLDYQYYTVKYGASNRETYYNFTYSGAIQSEAERRQFLVPSKTFTISDTDTSVISARRRPVFPNTRVLARRVKVKYTVDLRPAFYEVVLRGDTLSAIQGPTSVTRAVKDSIFKWGVWMNGPAVGGWGNPNGADWGSDLVNNLSKKMYDDGTHGDAVAGDSIYTTIIQCAPESISVGSKGVVGQTFKFGILGSDNEGGKGGYGNNHQENIVDLDTVYTIASQWGSINPNFYRAWNYDTQRPILTGVEELPGIATTFSLSQNYPNPFNPSTKLEFSIPFATDVQLKVFNILGQEVATIVNERLNAGRHAVTFDAARFATGVYVYRIVAGSYVSTKKMLLLK